MQFNNGQECPAVWRTCTENGKPLWVLAKVTNTEPWVGVRYGEYKRKRDAIAEAKRLAAGTRPVWVEYPDHYKNIMTSAY